MKYSAVPEIERLARQYNAKLDVEESEDGSYIDCVLQVGPVDLYILVSKFDNEYVASGLESSLLPRELYSDTIKKSGFSEKDRNDEILKNTELILSKKITFHPSPTLFNKKRGYILLNIDGSQTKLTQKSDKIISW